MKKTKLLVIAIVVLLIGIFIGFLVRSTTDAKEIKNEEQAIIDSSRIYLIELNKEHNHLFNIVGSQAMFQKNMDAMLAFEVLQRLAPKLFQLNRSLKLDCKEYNDDGTPQMIRDKDGNESPCEALPEEIKILE